MKFNKSFFAIALFLGAISFSCQESNFLGKANLLHEKILTVDTHTDTPLQLMHGNLDIGVKNNPRETRSKIDLPRMKDC